MIAMQCRDEAFAIIGTNTFIPKLANVPPLFFKKLNRYH
ncbi:MAG: hypothetical protein JETT_0053 [Candidatus Jettenia ecosi]|uniref:Uncharacterized protein n=1 Tax=Candidatus Jettenia ecosi TaxID=2494326 RepID=A0A533QG60_9BACT|nr:MAG: hypothetical protein JETT_0053 [Candidatus Jettenia ecosi]